MLLRSLTKHVKDQNWFAVALDFFIVVAGILLAFQITNWNEDRQAYHAERALTQRFLVEFNVLSDTLEQRLERGEQIMIETSDLIALIRNGEEPQDTAPVKAMLNSASRFSVPVSFPTSFSESLQSGRISSLENDTLREALNAYATSTDWWTTVGGPTQSQTDSNSRLNQSITWNVKRNLDGIGRSILTYDWGHLIGAERELVAIQQHQLLQAEAYRLELVEVHKVLAVLEKNQDG